MPGSCLIHLWQCRNATLLPYLVSRDFWFSQILNVFWKPCKLGWWKRAQETCTRNRDVREIYFQTLLRFLVLCNEVDGILSPFKNDSEHYYKIALLQAQGPPKEIFPGPEHSWIESIKRPLTPPSFQIGKVVVVQCLKKSKVGGRRIHPRIKDKCQHMIISLKMVGR